MDWLKAGLKSAKKKFERLNQQHSTTGCDTVYPPDPCQVQ